MDMIEKAAQWQAKDPKLAIATVIETWGSAPQPVGSQLVCDRHGDFAGAVSGGCVEGDVITAAMEAKAPRILEYGVADETAWRVGLACGGRIRILVEPLGDLSALLEAKRQRRAVAIATHLTTGAKRMIGIEAGEFAEAFRFDRSQIIGDEFVHIFNPPLRLVITGAVFIAQALLPMAQQAGYDVTIIDPRGAFASETRFPNVKLLAEWPDEVLPGMLDGRTAILALTHDPKIDDPALKAALASDCFYIGALGSKKTSAARMERLSGAGVSAENLARIHGPVGLNIGAQGANEIAISILAQMTQVLRLGRAS